MKGVANMHSGVRNKACIQVWCDYVEAAQLTKFAHAPRTQMPCSPATGNAILDDCEVEDEALPIEST